MALTLDTTKFPFRDRWNDCLVRRARLTGPGNYPTGGVAIDNLGDFGWSETHTLQGLITDGTTYYETFLDYTNQKVKVIAQSTGQEVANATNLAAFSGTILATGK